VAAGVLLGAGLVLYLERGPIGAQLARSYLRSRGVPAQITVERLDPGGFTGRVVLGDPRDPDLVVDHVEVEFEPAPLLRHGLVAPRIRSIRLVRPRVKARFDGRRLTFGTLQRLVDDFARRPPGVGPGPDIRLEQGAARVVTPAGDLRLTGDARLDQGRLATLSARLAPATLARPGFSAQLAGAAIEAHSDADELFATVVADVPQAGRGAAAGRLLHADLRATFGYDRAVRFDGPVRLAGAVTAAEVTLDRDRLTQPRLDVALQGRLQQPVDRLGFTGSGAVVLAAERGAGPGAEFQRLRLDGRAATVRLIQTETGGELGLDAQLSGEAAFARIAGLRGRGAHLSADVSRVNATWNRVNGFATALPAATLNLAALSGAGSRGRGLDLVLDPDQLEVSWGDAGWSVQTALRLRGRADRVATAAAGGSLGLRSASVAFRGPVNLSRRGLSADLRGGLSGQGGLDSAAATRLSAAVPVIGQDLSGRQAVEQALRSGRLSAPSLEIDLAPGRLVLHLPRPIEFAAASGGRASLAETRGGGLAFRTAGGGLPDIALDAARYQVGFDDEGLTFAAPARLRLTFSGSTWRDLAVRAEGRATRRAGVVDIGLTECAPVSAAAFGEGPEPLVTALKARACPDPSAPLVRLGPERWRMRTLVRDLAFDAPAGQVAVRDGEAAAELSGAGAEPVGAVTLTSARLQDAALMRRFEPLRLDGRVTLARGVWTGPLRIADGARGRPVARVDVRHTMEGATGHADISAADLAFAPDGLQPRDLTPVGADMVRDASGAVSFTGQADWRPGVVTSSGRLTTAGLDFRSPAGAVKQARTEMTFVSLAPLVSAPGQAVAADSVAAVVPLEAPTASVELRADRIVLERATAGAARGRVSLDAMELPFAPGSTLSGVLRLDDIDLDALIDQFNLAEKVSLEAKVDGALPFSWSEAGLRFSMGRVFATGPGRLTVRREALTTAVATGPTAAPGFQDIAYQALEDLAFDRLEAQVDSRPMGRLGVVFRINGRHDPPREGRTRISLFDLLRGHAFDKPIDLPKGTPVNLTLDTSLNFDELLAAYAGAGRSEAVQSGGPTS
jgi:hypothetical protein